MNNFPFKGSFIKVLIFTSALFILQLNAVSQKTDKVILTNGDVITAEIKKLEFKILQLKTSGMSTIQLKWHYVANIYAPDKVFEFELKDKSLIFGSLDTTKSTGVLRIKSEQGEYNLKMEQIVKIFQVREVFWRRFSGNLSAGVSYSKASTVLQTNVGGELSYIDKKNYALFDLSSIQTTQTDEDKVSKQDVNLSFSRTVIKSQFVTVFAGNQQNTELGIDQRIKAGVGYGSNFLHTNISRFRLTAGLLGNKEVTTEIQDATYNGEGFFGFEGRLFKYSDPEIYITTFVNYYPSFTVPGRNRAELEFKIKFELLNDLFAEFRFYDNYDSKPSSSAVSTNDFGIISSLSYSFGL